ncbi:hypothetical protein GCM10010349_31210 [Streptomyces flavofungini]|nr:hypothetical protein GCM10010349_31210 [Streptomyces flavofungini]
METPMTPPPTMTREGVSKGVSKGEPDVAVLEVDVEVVEVKVRSLPLNGGSTRTVELDANC